MLVVDDDFMVARIHTQFVERTPGFRVVGVASTGQAALDDVARLRPDLVLLDVHLPDMTGIDVLRRLRAGGDDVGVLVVTAAREADTVRAAASGGAVHYLVKPFDYDDLRVRLESFRAAHLALSGSAAPGQQDIDAVFGGTPPPRRRGAAAQGAEPGDRRRGGGRPGRGAASCRRRSAPTRSASRASPPGATSSTSWPAARPSYACSTAAPAGPSGATAVRPERSVRTRRRRVRFPLVRRPGGRHDRGMTPTGHLDTEACYRAVKSRDRRFDGVFYTAVRTTGIYCRPSCPARTPASANVTLPPDRGQRPRRRLPRLQALPARRHARQPRVGRRRRRRRPGDAADRRRPRRPRGRRRARPPRRLHAAPPRPAAQPGARRRAARAGPRPPRADRPGADRDAPTCR